MKAGWHEVKRIDAAPGSCARDAVQWFAEECFTTRRTWQWVDVLVGTFRVGDVTDLFRIRLGGAETDQWVFDVFNNGSSPCVQ